MRSHYRSCSRPRLVRRFQWRNWRHLRVENQENRSVYRAVGMVEQSQPVHLKDIHVALSIILWTPAFSAIHLLMRIPPPPVSRSSLDGVPHRQAITSRCSRVTHDNKVGEIGNARDQAGYLSYSNSIRIGDLEFQDCYVEVMEKRFSDSEDALLGADVFSDFLVDLDFQNHTVRLSQLPEDPGQPATPTTLDSQAELTRQPHDKYVAPGMKSFSPVYRIGHDLL